MSLATVTAKYAPLYRDPDENAVLADEVLFGMTVELLAPAREGWCHVRTRYRYEGWVREADLLCDGGAARQWELYGRMVARAPFVDVLAAPDHKSPLLATLPRGGLLHPLSEQGEDGWLEVEMPAGGKGYVKGGNLMPHRLTWKNWDEKGLREALATTAMSYLGTQYRFGGKTAEGIDCSGLVSLAYLLSGAVIWRDAKHVEGFDTHEIPRDKLGMGDVIYFDGHAGMYIGEGTYIHATGYDGSDGVVLNSLDEKSSFFREDLAKKDITCASLF